MFPYLEDRMPTIDLNHYPDEQICPKCHDNTWWFSGMNPKFMGSPQWLCGNCNPPQDPKLVLRMRIIKGNWLLNKVRLMIWKQPEPDNVALNNPDFINGLKLISELGSEYKKLGKDCIYLINGKKIKKCLISYNTIECFTCPNDYWPIAELEDSPREN